MSAPEGLLSREDVEALFQDLPPPPWYADGDTYKVISAPSSCINEHRTVALCATGDGAGAISRLVASVHRLKATALDALDRLAEAERKLDNALTGMVKLGEDVQRMRKRAEEAERKLAEAEVALDDACETAKERRDEAYLQRVRADRLAAALRPICSEFYQQHPLIKAGLAALASEASHG